MRYLSMATIIFALLSFSKVHSQCKPDKLTVDRLIDLVAEGTNSERSRATQLLKQTPKNSLHHVMRHVEHYSEFVVPVVAEIVDGNRADCRKLLKDNYYTFNIMTRSRLGYQLTFGKRDPNTAVLIGELQCPVPSIRSSAAELLWNRGDDSLKPLLELLAKEKLSASVRADVLRAADLCIRFSDATDEQLFKISAQSRSTRARKLAEVLIKSNSTVPPIVTDIDLKKRLASLHDPDCIVREVAASAIVLRHETNPIWPSVLRKCVTPAQWDLIRASLAILLNDPVETVRERAIDTLSFVCVVAGCTDREFQKQIMSLVKDSNPYVRATAMKMAARLGTLKFATPQQLRRLTHVLKDRREREFKAATNVISAFDWRTASKRNRRRLATILARRMSEPNPEIARLSAHALIALGKTGESALLKAYSSLDDTMKSEVVGALENVKFSSTQAIDALDISLRSDNYCLRWRAVVAIGRLTELPTKLVPVIDKIGESDGTELGEMARSLLAGEHF